ncbi:MAG: hypothetical protein C0603_04715 [Denitrovibrio sp.]|nr:MAG: hypothetical protein C0603_04715 [Denitrovibrio sp.]
MKLQSKIILIIIPFVFLSIIGLGYFAYSTSKNFAQDSFEKYMEGILSIYISQNVQPQYDLLVQNNLMDIPSFVNNYQSESAKLIDKLTLPWPGHFIIVTGEGKFVHTSVELKKNEIEEIWGKLAINLHKGNTEIDSGYVTDIDGAEFYKAMHFDPWNWYIFVSVHSGALTKSSNAIKKDATIISILTAIFLSLMIIFTTKKLIVTPIHKLSNAANEIGKTRKKVTIEINGNDEMSALSSQLESVSNEIEISDNKLKEWSNELEHQVKERTSELNEKNSMLNSEIEQKEIIQYDLMTAMKRYEDMVSGTDNLVTVVNPNGEYQYVNPAAENILGRNPKEMIGKLAFEDIHPDDQEYTLNHFQAWLKDKLVNTTIENRLLHQDGTSRIMQWNIFFNYDENKELVNINSIARDVTSAREAEEKLVEYSTQLEQTNNDVKSFAYIVSHDLRAPLVNMQGFVSELGYDLETLNEIINKNIDDIDDEDKPTMKDLLL